MGAHHLFMHDRQPKQMQVINVCTGAAIDDKEQTYGRDSIVPRQSRMKVVLLL